MANAVTTTRSAQSPPSGATVTQLTDYSVYHVTVDTVNTAETSVAIIPTANWREAIILVRASQFYTATTPQLIVNVWQLDSAQTPNRYGASSGNAQGTAPATNGLYSATLSTVSTVGSAGTGQKSLTITAPMGKAMEITFNTGTTTTITASSVICDIEVQFKSA